MVPVAEVISRGNARAATGAGSEVGRCRGLAAVRMGRSVTGGPNFGPAVATVSGPASLNSVERPTEVAAHGR